MSSNVTINTSSDLKSVKYENFTCSISFILLIGGIAAFIFASFTQALFLANNTIMTFEHKVFLYGFLIAAGVGVIGSLGLQILHGLNKKV